MQTFLSPKVLIPILCVVILAAVAAGSIWYIQKVEHEADLKGYNRAKLECNNEKLAFNAAMTQAVDKLRQDLKGDSKAAADQVAASASKLEKALTATVENAVANWKNNPIIRYDATTGKCKFDGAAFAKEWNKINADTNLQLVTTPALGGSK